jgi:hypothetical protein
MCPIPDAALQLLDAMLDDQPWTPREVHRGRHTYGTGHAAHGVLRTKPVFRKRTLGAF